MTEEGKLQNKIITLLEKQGYTCVKILSCTKSGWPDVEALHNIKPTLYIEVKTETGTVSPLQKLRHKQLNQLNKIIIVPFGWEDFLEYYKILEL